MSTLQTTLDSAIAEYNKAADTFSKLQEELLLRKGSILQLQALIKQEEEAVNADEPVSESDSEE